MGKKKFKQSKKEYTESLEKMFNHYKNESARHYKWFRHILLLTATSEPAQEKVNTIVETLRTLLVEDVQESEL